MNVAVTGGTPPYSYFWSNGTYNSTTSIVTLASYYEVTVVDAAGCTKNVGDTVNTTGLVVYFQFAWPPTCNGMNNGSMLVHVDGGTPPYTYLWNTGETEELTAHLTSGNYSVTITDSLGCSNTIATELTQEVADWSYYVTMSSTPANCTTTGSATVTVQGGYGPYSYSWNTTPAQHTPTATGLGDGYYTVSVADSVGCYRTGTVYISGGCYNIIDGYVYNDYNNNCLHDSGETYIPNVTVTATNGSQPYYGYTDSTGYYAINVSSVGTYSVNVSSAGVNSCINSNCGAQTTSFNNAGNTNSLSFGIGSSPNFNLALHPGWSSANPGFTKDYWILWYQTSLPTFNGTATVTFHYDSILVYQSHTQGGVHDPVAHTITWSVNNVPYPSWDWNSRPHAYFTVPANTPIGYQLQQEFWITPTNGDCNKKRFHRPVIFMKKTVCSLTPFTFKIPVTTPLTLLP
jgi:hypothetical protein